MLTPTVLCDFQNFLIIFYINQKQMTVICRLISRNFKFKLMDS